MRGADYWKYANETILTIAMIETQQALDNLDAILKTPGLDSIYVGPSDLGLSLGFQPGPDPTTPKVMEAIKFIVDTRQEAQDPGRHPLRRARLGARDDRRSATSSSRSANDNTLMRRARAAIAATREGRRAERRLY